MKIITHVNKIEIDEDELKDLRNNRKYLMMLTDGKNVEFAQIHKEQIMKYPQSITVSADALYKALEKLK